MKIISIICCFVALLQVPSFSQDSLKGITIRATDVKEFTSKINSLKYRVTISLPLDYSINDTTHYPVVYFTDGNYLLPMATYIYRRLNYRNGMRKVIMVGIDASPEGSSEQDPFRFLNYTPPTSSKFDYTIKATTQSNVVTGGAALFLEVLKQEVLPFIESSYRTSLEKTLVGQSLGGLFACYTLFEKPDLFSQYLISSPSLYWDYDSMAKREAEFFRSGQKFNAVKVFIAVGGLEEKIMLDGMKQMATRLKSRNYQGLQLVDNLYEDETHLSIISLSISRGLRFFYEVKSGK